jgi:hypothetical protein
MSLYITLLLTLMQTGPLTLPRLERSAPVDHPLTTIGTSWVVLQLETDRLGKIQSVETLHGASPFLDLALSSVRQWGLIPAGAPQPVESPVTVVFLFRPRDFFSASPVKPSQSSRRTLDHAPFPLELADPGYPISSVGEGAAVLELAVSQTGSVERARVVSDVPGLAAHTEKTVRQWKFRPAMRSGSAVAGSVIVVASYLRPIINEPPNPVVPNYQNNPPPPAIFKAGPAAPPKPL